ncbi:hypothetical protein FQV39_04580 [Bosea sp. F3-2]|uniref:hypothetical protein n=1 Tax=Bosea sp. F3-2 TaxID=2599640 RepID=UPI0011EFC332|nr:hypothetical protein [Bosea sp. F3-2]QEL21933.1 hypothetical protein FQV39_04580 [Bosea sp. F3-2]
MGSTDQKEECVSWPIEEWPKRAHAWLDALQGAQRPVSLQDARLGRALGTGRIQDTVHSLTTKERDRIEVLWGRAFGGSSGLADFLREATTSDEPGQTAYAIPTPTLEASLLLPLERARTALETVGGQASPLAMRPLIRPSMRSLAAIGRPWLGAAEPMIQLAAAGVGALDLNLARQLIGPPDVAEWLAQCECGHANDDHPYARMLDFEAIVAAALGRGNEDLLWLSDRMHALHHASFHLVAANDKELEKESGPGGRRLHQLLASPALMRLFGFARDMLLDLPPVQAKGETAVRCELLPQAGDMSQKHVATILDLEAASFFPAVPNDWGRVLKDPTTAPWGKSGLRVLSPKGHPHAHACSIEPTLCVESDHQCQANGRPTRLITGPLSLYPPEKSDPGTADNAMVYATDLRAPSRLLIGIDTANKKTSWFPTSVRTVSFLDPWLKAADANWPQAALRTLTPSWLTDLERDAAGVAAKIQYQMQAGENAPLHPTYDKRIAAYNGDDLGGAPNELPAAPPVGQTAPWKVARVELKQAEDILVGQRVKVASAAELCPLMFGWTYRLALDDRTIGGGGPTLDHARQVLSDHESPLPWPPYDKPGFRYLRHEPIAKPIVLLAPGTKREGSLEHKLQTSERMIIVRAANPQPDDARSLNRTSRILLVPAVACASAARHDVFDAAVEQTFIRVRNKQNKWANVPVKIPRQGLRDAYIEGDEAIVANSKGVKLPTRFRVRGQREKREIRCTPYYPDPAAAILVVRLVHPEHGGWLDDPPLLIRVRQPIESKAPDSWPDVLPVRIDLMAVPKSETRRLSDGGWDKASSSPAAPSVDLRVVTVKLAPGETVRLRAWLVPDAADLAAWFDAVDKAATLAQAEGHACGSNGATAPLIGLVSLLGDRACADRSGLDAVAASFHLHMRAEPLAEIADTLDLDLIYASDKSNFAPEFLAGSAGFARPSTLDQPELARFLNESGPASEWQLGDAAEDGATAVVPGGTITFDPATTHEIIIEAELVAPGNSTLDLEPRVLPPQLAPFAPESLPFNLTAEDTAHFGWDDGSKPVPTSTSGAPLQPRWVELLKISNIPLPPDARAGLRELRLETVMSAVDATFAGAAIAFTTILSQSQARRARLRARSLPRHSALITSPNKADAPAPADRSVSGKPTELLWIPSTSRPAPVAVKDVLPEFKWPKLVRRQSGARLTIEGERTSSLRLWLHRPWFSSGEDERLGIVLWPPPTLSLVDGEAATFVPNDKSLHGLHEADLGPLGGFVSVWGYDPLGAGPAPANPQQSDAGRDWRSIFLDNSHIDLGTGSRFHPHLLMPVPGQFDVESLTMRETMAAVSVLSAPAKFAHDLPAVTGIGPSVYADLNMLLPTAHDTIFKLGLVRLQEHARKDHRGAPRANNRAGIRLSAPTTVQGRIPPPRQFSVNVTPIDARHGAAGTAKMISVMLSGPRPAIDGGAKQRRVRIAVRERRGGDEFPIIDDSGRDCTSLWVGGDAYHGIDYRVSGSEERWTATFRVADDILQKSRNVVASIEEEAWLPPSSGGVPTVALPRFSVTVALHET